MHFVLPLNSPLLKPVPSSRDQIVEPTATTTLNRFQTPPLTAQSAGAPTMNSPYSRMCDQLEHFVDAEIEFTDNLLFNRPLNERNTSVDLSPELEKASISSASPPQNHSTSPQSNSIPPTTESRSLWLGNVDPTVTEEEIRATFEPFGMIENIRLLPAKECAFVNYFELESAIRGRNAMQGKPLGNMILRIGFGKIAENPREASNQNNINNNNYQTTIQSQGQSRSVWIGNLGPEITSDLLMIHFNIFGPIESCRVLEAKNCAFVNFYNAEAAAMAKIKMNGALIGNSIIKTGNAKDNTTNSTSNNTSNNSSFNINNEPIISLMKANTTTTKQQAPQMTFASITANQVEEEIEEIIDGTQLREFRRIVENSPEEIPKVLEKLMKSGNLSELAIDSYGNILLQKIVERAQATEQLLILNSLKGSMSEIAMNKNGTWVIQKLITAAADFSVQSETIEELKENTLELLEDQFGNYVIQCILASDNENLKFIIDKIVQNSRKLAVGKFSSRALKSILDSSNLERQKLIAQSLAKESVLLSVDPNGAVVIQWILDSELPGKIGLVTGQLQGRLAQVALTKQGSVIVARIIGSSDEPNYRDSAILELYELTNDTNDLTVNNSFKPAGHLDSLLTEPATCSILFKAYQVSKPAIRLRLTDKLRPKLMKILKEITGEQDEKVIENYSDRDRDEKIPVHLTKLYQELIKRS